MSEVENITAIESLYDFNKALTELGSKSHKEKFKEIFDKKDNKFSEGIDFFKLLLNDEVVDYLKSFQEYIFVVEGSGNTLKQVIIHLTSKKEEDLRKFETDQPKFVADFLNEPDQIDNQGAEEAKGSDKFKANDKPKRNIFQPLPDLTVIEHMVELDFKRRQKEIFLKSLTDLINIELKKVFIAKTQAEKKTQFVLFKKFLNFHTKFIEDQVKDTKSRFNALVDDIVEKMYNEEYLHPNMRHHLAKLFELDIDGLSGETVRVHFPLSGEAFGVTCELEHDLKRANPSFIDLEDLKDILLLIKRKHLEKIFKIIIDHSEGTDAAENSISSELYGKLEELIKFSSISEENCTYFVQKIMEKEKIFVTQNNKGTTKINKTIRHDGDLVSGTSIAPDFVNNSEVKLSSDADNAVDYKLCNLKSLTVIKAKLLKFDAGNGPKFITDRQYENRMRELKHDDTSKDYMPDIILTHNDKENYIQISYEINYDIESNDDTGWFRITFLCPPLLKGNTDVTNAITKLNNLGLTFSTASITEITSIVSRVINKLAELWNTTKNITKGDRNKKQKSQDRNFFLEFIKENFFSDVVSKYFCTIIYLTSLIKMLGDLITYIVVLARVIVLDDDDDTEKCFMLSSKDYSLIFQALGTIRFQNNTFQRKFDNSKTSAFVHIKNTDMVIPISEKEKKIYKMMMYLTASNDDSNLYKLFEMIQTSGVLPLYNDRNLKKQLSELTDILVTIRLEIDTLINNRLEIIRSQNSNTSDEDIKDIVLQDPTIINLKYRVKIVNKLMLIITNLINKTNRIGLDFTGIEQDHREILTALSEKASFKDLIINLFDVIIPLFEPIAKDPYIITLINKLESYLNSMMLFYDLKEYYDNKLEKLGDLMIFLNGFDSDNIFTDDNVVDENVYDFARSVVGGDFLSKRSDTLETASYIYTGPEMVTEMVKGTVTGTKSGTGTVTEEEKETVTEMVMVTGTGTENEKETGTGTEYSSRIKRRNKDFNSLSEDSLSEDSLSVPSLIKTFSDKSYFDTKGHPPFKRGNYQKKGGKTLKKRRRKKKPRSSRKLKLKLKDKNNNKSKKNIYIPENKYKTSKKKK